MNGAKTSAGDAARPASSWRKLVTPQAAITDLGERRTAQLVAVVALALAGLSALSLGVAAAVDAPLFWSRLPVVAVLELSFALIFVLNRTRFHDAAALLLCLGPVWSDLAVGLSTPDDPVWYGFVTCGVVLASTLLSFRAALAVGVLGMAATASVVLARWAALGRARSILVLAFVALFTAVVLATARFRAWVEAGRREELKALERKLASTARMEAVGRLAASVAHDFNNFLTIIEGNAQLARGADGAQRLDEILVAVDKASALTAQLLSFARQKPTKRVPVSLDELTRRLLPILERVLGPRVQLVLDLHTGWVIEADPVQVEQVLLNLASNARDAMAECGTLEISTRDAARAAPQAHGAPGDYVVLSVRDDGAGMDASTLEQAFEPFFTTKQDGKNSGLGLATVRSIVLQHGGHLHVDSEPGRGTCFVLWWPRFQAQAVASERSSAAARTHQPSP